MYKVFFRKDALPFIKIDSNGKYLFFYLRPKALYSLIYSSTHSHTNNKSVIPNVEDSESKDTETHGGGTKPVTFQSEVNHSTAPQSPL